MHLDGVFFEEYNLLAFYEIRKANSAYSDRSALSWMLKRCLDLVLCLCDTKHKSLQSNTGIWSFEKYMPCDLGSQELLIVFKYRSRYSIFPSNK